MSRPPHTERWMETMAELLRLELRDDWRPGIKTHLETAGRMAALLETAKLKDDAEPAPVYRP